MHSREQVFLKSIAHFEFMVEEFFAVHEMEKEEQEPGECWKPPPVGWFKVNTDVAFKAGNATIVFTVKDDK